VRLLVTGSRDWPLSERMVVFRYLNRLNDRDMTLIHGGCPVGADVPGSLYKGVDGLADLHARLLNWKVVVYPPDPSKGRARFAIRNKQMVDEHPDKVLAFFLKDAENRGTKMTYDMASGLYRIKVTV
jgi:hypothetical protein